MSKRLPTAIESTERRWRNSFREVLLGITGKDFTILAASKAAMRGATILKASDDKTRELNRHTLMAFSGEAGDTSMLSNRCSRRHITPWLTSTSFLPSFLPFSTLCRIHPGQYTALFYAEWFRSGTLGCCKLRSWGIGTQPEIEKAVYGQFATGGVGSDYKEAEFVLAGLSGGVGSIAVRCAWIRSVCSWWSLLFWILIFFFSPTPPPQAVCIKIERS